MMRQTLLLALLQVTASHAFVFHIFGIWEVRYTEELSSL
jgi:hypothetical protein